MNESAPNETKKKSDTGRAPEETLEPGAAESAAAGPAGRPPYRDMAGGAVNSLNLIIKLIELEEQRGK